MNHNPILNLLDTATDYRRMKDALEGGKGPVAAFGVAANAKAHLCCTLARTRQVLFVTATDTAATQLCQSARLFGTRAELFLPRETPLVYVHAASGEGRGERISALSALLDGAPCVVAASAAALMQALAPRGAFAGSELCLSVGDTLEPRALVERIVSAGYERVEMVEGRGQTAARGDLVDVYAPGEEYPVRIEFFGDEIDQMRSFDPVSQRSVEQAMRVCIRPALETPQPKELTARALKRIEGRPGLSDQEDAWREGVSSVGGDVLLPLLYPKTDTLLDYLSADAVLVLDEALLIDEALRTEQLRFAETVQAMLERGEGVPEQGALERGANETLERLHTGRTALLYALSRTHPQFAAREIVSLESRGAPQFLGAFDEIAREVKRLNAAGERTAVYAGEQTQELIDNLAEYGAAATAAGELPDELPAGKTLVLPGQLARGFSYPQLKLNIFTEFEVTGRTERAVKRTRSKKQLSFSELSVGDYIVHETHGVGRFVKVEPLTVQGNTRDYLLIEYRGGDRLYIPTDQLDRVQKYIGGGDEELAPPLSKLGGAEWTNRVNKAKSAAKKLAVDLAALYAERASAVGFAFSKDTAWQRTFEERFPYELTPDQKQSMEEIKADMEQLRPMDRLLCGDVGYGKTELALRAVFKAVQDGKQAAILVPTTILAQQHYNTMRSRFADFPVKTACLSRFQTVRERNEIKKALADGQIDAVVGTHALLAKDVTYKSLGLLIVDEEHRFGVNHKEQIKAMKKTVDVLTLTATPIPRTLNMSMTGIRDISVIETPPEARYPVQTYVLEYTDALVKDALTRELARKGQAYVVSNRVQSMEQTARKLEALVPEARIAIAHGQMGETQLENAMLDFLEQRTDVLLCSTIIESGLDISNANTLVVMDADKMGLAQLYQLRGRVGRSNRIGYAYFTVQTGRVMNEKAAKRLMAIREFTQFGAGFQLAMRDLEIRGAGSLLGAEQHGHISDVGYEYYVKLVRRAVDEQQGRPLAPVTETSVDIPIDAHIPHDYVPSELLRLKAYRRIAEIDGAESLLDVTEEFIDRYGEPPQSVTNLMRVSEVKAYAACAFIESVTVREGEAKLKFSEHARLDGGKLIAAVSNMEGARLIASDPPAIEIRQKNATAEAITEKLPQFLYTIVRCVDAEAGI
ncbi:MAG: transcription-repair coupling factor [Clostridiales bacterium]|nr:transcription-repair coupling factor [Clostridiales bacterium]